LDNNIKEKIKYEISRIEKLINDAKPPYTIEPASPSERKRIQKRVKEFHENPASFVPFKA